MAPSTTLRPSPSVLRCSLGPRDPNELCRDQSGCWQGDRIGGARTADKRTSRHVRPPPEEFGKPPVSPSPPLGSAGVYIPQPVAAVSGQMHLHRGRPRQSLAPPPALVRCSTSRPPSSASQSPFCAASAAGGPHSGGADRVSFGAMWNSAPSSPTAASSSAFAALASLDSGPGREYIGGFQGPSDSVGPLGASAGGGSGCGGGASATNGGTAVSSCSDAGGGSSSEFSVQMLREMVEANGNPSSSSEAKAAASAFLAEFAYSPLATPMSLIVVHQAAAVSLRKRRDQRKLRLSNELHALQLRVLELTEAEKVISLPFAAPPPSFAASNSPHSRGPPLSAAVALPEEAAMLLQSLRADIQLRQKQMLEAAGLIRQQLHVAAIFKPSVGQDDLDSPLVLFAAQTLRQRFVQLLTQSVALSSSASRPSTSASASSSPPSFRVSTPSSSSPSPSSSSPSSSSPSSSFSSSSSSSSSKSGSALLSEERVPWSVLRDPMGGPCCNCESALASCCSCRAPDGRGGRARLPFVDSATPPPKLSSRAVAAPCSRKRPLVAFAFPVIRPAVAASADGATSANGEGAAPPRAPSDHSNAAPSPPCCCSCCARLYAPQQEEQPPSQLAGVRGASSDKLQASGLSGLLGGESEHFGLYDSGLTPGVSRPPSAVDFNRAAARRGTPSQPAAALASVPIAGCRPIGEIAPLLATVLLRLVHYSHAAGNFHVGAHLSDCLAALVLCLGADAVHLWTSRLLHDMGPLFSRAPTAFSAGENTPCISCAAWEKSAAFPPAVRAPQPPSFGRAPPLPPADPLAGPWASFDAAASAYSPVAPASGAHADGASVSGSRRNSLLSMPPDDLSSAALVPPSASPSV
eukprot:GHVT01041027.1.p1 GENE.GHVT01041027.1~~GHVT01041027.1.p1  ORF type:complete len:862 (-),score=239.82 GHVT01041027.1:383-2968(-)